MSLLRSAFPWIFFTVLGSKSWQAAAIAAAASSLVIVVQKRRADTGWEDLILDVGTLAYFVLLAAFASVSPHSGLRPYSGAGSHAFLGLVAWFSMAVRKPFTMDFAKQSTPKEIWTEPRFLKVNMTISAFWAAAFTVTAPLIALAYHATHKSLAAASVQLVGLAVAGLLTVRYAAHARAKGAAATVGNAAA
ncbi:hypothetical protein [Streptantibioticus ferralitis]|uniref:Uncharacterized protein n=1 Tax=Streptantibioticus ferralitis TaxID=236510 RepID=A0ABT5ZEN8_9ACTN|nr:hypothetical protein [Streptantibioticus ferralitis]MDF2261495.1 hypothetical protein [Streptantibioticus ferralitis]